MIFLSFESDLGYKIHFRTKYVGGWPKYFMWASFGVIGNVSDDFWWPTIPPPPTPARFRLTSPPKPGFRSFRLTGTKTRVQIRNRARVGGGGVVGRQKSLETLPMTPKEASLKYLGHPPTYLLRKCILNLNSLWVAVFEHLSEKRIPHDVWEWLVKR